MLSELKELVEDQDKLVVGGMVALVTDPLAHIDLKLDDVADDPRQFSRQLPTWRDNLPSCGRDILADYPGAPDGDYVIWLNGDGLRPVRLFCTMGDEPKEYLRLKQPNSSMVRGDRIGGEFPGYTGNDLITKWDYIRLDVRTLEVDLNDFSGATTTGGPAHGWTAVRFGTAAQCAGTQAAEAEALVDITDTPFVFHPSVSFASSGYEQSGRFTHGPTSTSVGYAVRGRCGLFEPSVGAANRLVLQYASA